MENEHPKISVIIVNYNVEYFLEQCLNSVFDALKEVSGEVFVVDNNSIDGSVAMVREKFPDVHLIANKENTGFSRANNQAIRLSKGKYVLLLNPDTVVEEDTFQKCLDFMDSKPDAGGLGVHMIDGKGNFLPESKRGLPTPAVAFYKIFGLSRLFPKSKKFGQYHLGYLPEYETNEVEILSGAFMLMRKETLDKVGLLDETFFMYGEDIDLSYRITQGGYKNYYFPETQIIHYKGESTKKSSVNYVFIFYRAMVIFAKKHFSQKNAKLFSFFINLAIYFRAGLALLNRFVKKIFIPLVDFSIILMGLYGMTNFWVNNNIELPQHILAIALPFYTLCWLATNFYAGSYDIPIKLKSYFWGTTVGTFIILAIYALLPKEAQFSRLFILTGAILTYGYFLLSRFIFHLTIGGKFNLRGVKNKNFAIVGEPEEVERIQQILENTPHRVKSVFSVSPTSTKNENDSGTLNQLDQIIDIHKIDEVIFSAKNTAAENIIKWMAKTGNNQIEFKIAQPNSIYLIGSNSIDTAGDLYVMDIDNITTQSGKRNKRTFDFIISFFALLLSPILIWFYAHKKQFLSNMGRVFIGQKSIVGYAKQENENTHLPHIKTGILTPTIQDRQIPEHEHKLDYKLNLIYAKNYTIAKDIEILKNNWRLLDS